jgi:peptidoglycan hydrolase CwlO-like protein
VVLWSDEKVIQRGINMNIKYKISVLITGLIFVLSFSAVNADEIATLEEAKEKIALLESENQSLKVQIEYFDKEIAEYRKKLEQYDNEISSIKVDEE